MNVLWNTLKGVYSDCRYLYWHDDDVSNWLSKTSDYFTIFALLLHLNILFFNFLSTFPKSI